MDWLGDHWGDTASAVGLGIAIVGFGVAIWQIIRTRQAAEAAEHAVISTRDSLAKNATIADLVRVSERIEDIKRLHRERQWERALDRYHDMRVVLSDIRARHPGLSDKQQSVIQQATDQIVAIERAVKRAVGTGNDPADSDRYFDFLIDAQGLVDELASNLRQAL